MTDLETRLERALQAGAAPARDPMFRVQLLLRRERKAFRRRLLAGLLGATSVALVASLALAGLGELAGSSGRPLGLAAVAALCLAVFLVAGSARADLLGLASGWWTRAASRLRTLPRPRVWS